FNDVYGWEENKKFELGLDLGFLSEKLLVSFSYFNNRSSNQLVDYRLPYQTGFSGIIRNFPAVIQNSGVEIEASSTNISRNGFEWKSSLNFSMPRNKLVSFPGLESSSYSSIYIEGEPLDVIFKLNEIGVDPTSGIFRFEDVNNDGIIRTGFGQDYIVNGHVSPKFFGGLSNTLSFKNLEVFLF